MVLKPEPLFEAVEKLLGQSMGDSAREPALPRGIAVVLLSAAGKMFRQETARRLAKLERIVLICGRYEGVDERVADHLATEEISVGDYVLSGGELPAAVVLDAVTRLQTGALGNEASNENESFRKLETDDSISMADNSHLRKTRLLLDYPHYTRPSEYRGGKVPDVLIGGLHAEVAKWRARQAAEKTRRNRPDLLVFSRITGTAHPKKGSQRGNHERNNRRPRARGTTFETNRHLLRAPGLVPAAVSATGRARRELAENSRWGTLLRSGPGQARILAGSQPHEPCGVAT